MRITDPNVLKLLKSRKETKRIDKRYAEALHPGFVVESQELLDMVKDIQDAAAGKLLEADSVEKNPVSDAIDQVINNNIRMAQGQVPETSLPQRPPQKQPMHPLAKKLTPKTQLSGNLPPTAGTDEAPKAFSRADNPFVNSTPGFKDDLHDVRNYTAGDQGIPQGIPTSLGSQEMETGQLDAVSGGINMPPQTPQIHTDSPMTVGRVEPIRQTPVLDNPSPPQETSSVMEESQEKGPANPVADKTQEIWDDYYANLMADLESRRETIMSITDNPQLATQLLDLKSSEYAIVMDIYCKANVKEWVQNRKYIIEDFIEVGPTQISVIHRFPSDIERVYLAEYSTKLEDVPGGLIKLRNAQMCLNYEEVEGLWKGKIESAEHLEKWVDYLMAKGDPVLLDRTILQTSLYQLAVSLVLSGSLKKN